MLAERPEPIESATTAGGKLFATYLKDVTTRAYVYSLDGKLENEIALPGPGSAGGFGGPHDAAFVFYTFNSLSVPPTIYRYDIAARKSIVFRAPNVPGYDASQFETKQVFYPSKDGTRIPMFLVYRKGLKLDGNNPTLLYGYGGFNIVAVADVQRRAHRAARAGVRVRVREFARRRRVRRELAPPGHEAREAERVRRLHRGGRVARSRRSTRRPPKLAIQGGSNGGLLVGAVMNQRPELFRVGIPQVGVMDMLRFHKFTIGWNWIADYGSSDDAGRVQGAVRVLAAAQHQAGREVSRHADHDGRPRRPRRAGALVQVRRDAAVAREPRKSRSDPDRDEVGARREQPHEAARDHGRRRRVRDVQPRRDAEVLAYFLSISASASFARRNESTAAGTPA